MSYREKIKKIRDNKTVLFMLVLLLKRVRKIGIFRGEIFFKHVPFVGEFLVKVPSGGVFKMKSYGGQIENRLFWNGIFGHEPGSISTWLEISKNAKTVLDIGSNSGLFALAAAAAGSKQVHAFEPIERIYNVLQGNVSLSDFRNVNCWNCAIGSERGNLEIYDPGGDAPTSASLSSRFAADHLDSVITTTVVVESLDSWVTAHCVQNVELIKLDVEGYEEAALLGMRELVKRDRPFILIEVLDEYNISIRQLVQELWGDNYEWCPIYEGKNDPSRNVLLTPRLSRV
ncbi:MAG: FkbM family methyltransferase [Crocinitomicaceae bacterium]|nr:FkbM family methyltransferase [Crocinitomicaceae bacterium]